MSSANEITGVASPIVEFVAFPSAVYNGAQQTVDYDNPNWNSGLFTLNMTSYGSVGTTTLEVMFKDPATGNYLNIASKTMTAAGQIGVNVGLGAGAVGNFAAANCALPRTFAIKVVPPDGNANTYSVGVSLSR